MSHFFIIRSPWRAVLILVALVTLSTPGAAQAVPGERRPVPPSIAAFVDSAALMSAVAALPALVLPEGMQPLFTIDFDSTGAPKSVKPMFDEMPAAYADPVVAAIRAHLKPQAPSREPLLTHLRVRAGAQPLVDHPELREELPYLSNRMEMSRFITRQTGDLLVNARAFPDSVYQANVRFRLLGDGRADTTTVAITRSTGKARLDSIAIRVIGHMRFSPARIEGIPVRVWVTIPVTFRSPEGRAFTSARLPGWRSVVGFSEIAYATSEQDRRGPSVGCVGHRDGQVEVEVSTNRRPSGPPASVGEGIAGSYQQWPGEMTVVAGTARATVPARVVHVPYFGNTRVTAFVPIDHAVLAAFAETGELTVSTLGETRRTRRAPVELVRRMLAACGQTTAP